MDVTLPQEKTFFRSKLACIYCEGKVPSRAFLTREHIIPDKIRGRLILRHASCGDCAKIINTQIETFMLGRTLKSPRTHLGMKTSKPVRSLPVGRWDAETSEWPTNMSEVNFRWEELLVEDHPLSIGFPMFPPPGILWDLKKTELFTVIGFSSYTEGKHSSPARVGVQTAECTMLAPDIILRFIAKIAHSAAVAAFGDNLFTPLLPDIILGKDKYISHLVGSRLLNRSKSQNLHEIKFYLRRRFIIAEVRLFSTHIRQSYLAVVAKSPEPMATFHTSALMRSAC